MPPKKAAMNDDKRKSPPSSDPSASSISKKSKTSNFSSDPLCEPHPNAKETEENGIVLRNFCPHEMSNARAFAYNNNELLQPIELLSSALLDTQISRDIIKVNAAVVHWFKRDLRTRDNKALYMASDKAKEKGVPLVTMYIVSPQDFEAHSTAPVRVDFLLRSLQVLKEDLERLDIPLYVETVEKRKHIPERMIQLLKEWGASHIFTNVEYEVDELRREVKMVRLCLEKNIAMDVVPDSYVVRPGELSSGTGKQYSVYTPWFRAWVTHIHKNTDLLDLFDAPTKNPDSARKNFTSLFDSKIPTAPENKRLSDEEKKRFRSMWPAGEQEARDRLKKIR